LLLPLLKLQGALWVSSLFALVSGGLALRIEAARPTKSDAVTEPPRFTIPRSIGLPILLAVICGIGFGAFLQFLPLLTERRGGLASGPIFAVYGAGIALTRMLIARWMDEGDQRLILRIGFLLVTLGLFLFAIGQFWPVFAGGALCVAAGAGMQTGLLMNLHVEALPNAARGRAIAFYYLGFDLGIGGGAWLLAPVLERWDVGGLYLSAAVISLIGALMVQFVRHKPPVGEPMSMVAPAR
jgi:predicted MFS family arabinose efflux permease